MEEEAAVDEFQIKKEKGTKETVNSTQENQQERGSTAEVLAPEGEDKKSEEMIAAELLEKSIEAPLQEQEEAGNWSEPSEPEKLVVPMRMRGRPRTRGDKKKVEVTNWEV